MTWWPGLPNERRTLGYADWDITGIHQSPDRARLLNPRQVHEAAIIVADTRCAANIPREERPPADGIVTAIRAQPVAVQTADCLPVLFGHPEAVMAVHGGWRGIAKGILGEAIANYSGRGARTDVIDVIIGPAISAAHFEIGPEVVDAFVDAAHGLASDAFTHCFTKGVRDRWHLDLQAFAALELIARGITPERIRIVRACTYGHASHWYSFRREGGRTGSNWSWIELR